MQPMHVFFFRGLSTYGGDSAKWSIFDFGPVSKNYARAFRARGAQFHAVEGMGAGSLSAVSARALTLVKAHPVWRQGSQPVHFFGHSAGGLVARLVAANLANEQENRGRVQSLVTVATPHRGTTIAQACIDMPKTHPGSNLFLRSCGYNVMHKREFFAELTAARVRATMAPVLSSEAAGLSAAKMGSIICAAPRTDWCLPLRLFYQIPVFRALTGPSDGVVDRDTQAFAQVLAELPLDHFRQVGLFGHPERFEKMIDVLTEFFQSHRGSMNSSSLEKSP